MKLEDLKNQLLLSSKQALETVPIEPLIIDELGAYEIMVRTEFCLEKMPELLENAFNRIADSIHFYPPQSSLLEEHPTLRGECSVSAKHQWRKFVDGYPSVEKLPSLPSLCYAAIAVKGKGCHELLFGEERKVTLSRRETLFLQSMKGIRYLQQKHIINYLYERTIDVRNPLYVMKTRSYEVAEDMGYDTRYGLFLNAADKDKTADITKLRQWTKRNFHPELPVAYDWSNNLTSQMVKQSGFPYWYKYIFLFCASNLITADRLLIQDFSPFAYMPDGTPLTDTQRDWLSAYLNTTAETQQTACVMAFSYLEQLKAERKTKS